MHAALASMAGTWCGHSHSHADHMSCRQVLVSCGGGFLCRGIPSVVLEKKNRYTYGMIW